MPLNQLQLKTLREALSEHIDTLFTSTHHTAEHYLSQHVLQNVILSLSEVVAHLRH